MLKIKQLFPIIILSAGLSMPLFAQADLAEAFDVRLKSTSDSLGADFSKDKLVLIGDITLSGNKRTKSRVILRELSIESGKAYNYSDLKQLIVDDKNKIYNTSLFNEVDIDIVDESLEKVDIKVTVSERWYMFVIPLIDLVDRNFNDWWKNHNLALNRLTYGVSVNHFNMRGMNERLDLTAEFGFTRNFAFKYTAPYIDKNQRNGLSFGAGYKEYTNVHFDNINNRRVFMDTELMPSENVLKTLTEASIGYSRRNSFYVRHNVGLTFVNESIADTIALANSNYYGNGATSQTYFNLRYELSIDHRDISAYPLKGYRINAKFEKDGLGIFGDVDKTSLWMSYSTYGDLGKGYFLSNYTSAYLSFPNQQSYTLTKGLGFREDIIRGYEEYVIHGQSYFINKTVFKKRLISKKAHWKSMPLEQFKFIPFAVYLKSYMDLGYAKNTQQYEGNALLADRFLYGTGLGLDIVLLYDIALKLEYSLNREMEHGFVFNIASAF